MPLIQRRPLLPRLSVALIGAFVMLITSSGFAQAYIGPPPPPVPVPGGYLSVVTSQTFGPRGGTIGPALAGNLQVVLTIPAGAYQKPLQYTITEPSVADISGIGFCPRCGFRAVAGAGVIIQNANGTIFKRAFHRSLTLTISSPILRRRDIVVVWNGASFVRAGAKIRHHMATVGIGGQGYHFYAVVQRHRLHRCPRKKRHDGLLAMSASNLASLLNIPMAWLAPGLSPIAAEPVHVLSAPVGTVVCWRRGQT